MLSDWSCLRKSRRLSRRRTRALFLSALIPLPLCLAWSLAGLYAVRQVHALRLALTWRPDDNIEPLTLLAGPRAALLEAIQILCETVSYIPTILGL